jgi:hypothetical protein
LPVVASEGGGMKSILTAAKTKEFFHVLSTPVYILEDDCVVTVMAALPNTTRPTTSIAKRRRKRTTCESRKNYRLYATWLADHVCIPQNYVVAATWFADYV